MKLEDYGFLSDTETAALVGRNGSIDWLCMPRFDSPACFAKLLGTEANGYWQIAPEGAPMAKRRHYRDGSLVLETEFETEDGVVRLIDFMPLREDFPEIVRIVEGVRGRVRMRMELVIRCNYGSAVPWVQRRGNGIVAIAGPDGLILKSDVRTSGENLSTVADFAVAKGQQRAFVLTWFPSHQKPPAARQSDSSLRRTEKFWRNWSGRCQRENRWPDAVKRSLVVLKGLTYAPTGGILAAPTTSLPEYIGGVRNWDYRFCWLRDATFTLFALMNAGYTEEAKAWRDWLLRAVAGSPDQMQILYGVGGERLLPEIELGYLAGYEGSRPVRLGNAAAGQFQLDVFGEVLGAMHQARKSNIPADKASWDLEKNLVDFVIRHWKDPDEGMWEVRGGRRNFTHSKMMAWMALDRAIQGCEDFGLEGDLKKWRRVRREIHREVCARGFNAKLGAFTQSYDDNHLDGSLLMMPIIGFLPIKDRRVRSTIAAIEKDLTVDGFVLRYRPENSADGLPPGEGVFLPCSFWLATCMNLQGRREEAAGLFERLLSLRNDLGLFSEEYDPRAQRLVGNFPQAFTHVSMVNSAYRLSGEPGPAGAGNGKRHRG